MADITTLLDTYQATIVGGANGLFRLQFEQGDGQGRSRKPDGQAAQREDRQSRGSRAVSARFVTRFLPRTGPASWTCFVPRSHADGRQWRMKSRRVALALYRGVAVCRVSTRRRRLGMNMMRTPNINVGSRIPVNPTIAPRVDPNIAGRTNVVTGVDQVPSRVTTTPSTMRIPAHQSQLDDALCALFAEPLSGLRSRLSRRRRRVHAQAGRLAAAAAATANRQEGQGQQSAVQRPPRPASTCASFANQFVAEIDGALTDAQVDELARRHGLALVESQNFPLIGATIGLFRITGNRPADEVRRELRRRGRRPRSPVQFALFRAGAEAPTEGDPAQYAVRSSSCRRRMRWRTA